MPPLTASQLERLVEDHLRSSFVDGDDRVHQAPDPPDDATYEGWARDVCADLWALGVIHSIGVTSIDGSGLYEPVWEITPELASLAAFGPDDD